ncbi:DMT family protein [Pseudoroseicyclus sp. CLL3-39]|uniref:DMT family protein n=1 Tax=Pseudoroseicyclus tamaricis TaxID=2705421 RepID=A0A6B2JS19_9RHOB|nr:DMT family protein [Pseudoroseicyclus tamaricis]NDV01008.1 DMT family protein [Pseudoroseicyclus tamaricis]
MPFSLPVPLVTIGLLTASNLFMTFAWYGHLKFKAAPLVIVILVAWGIAFFEYVLQVPANRIGHGRFSAAELKTIQEVISLTIFCAFSALWLGEPIRPAHILGFSLIALGAGVIFLAPGAIDRAPASP